MKQRTAQEILDEMQAERDVFNAKLDKDYARYVKKVMREAERDRIKWAKHSAIVHETIGEINAIIKEGKQRREDEKNGGL